MYGDSSIGILAHTTNIDGSSVMPFSVRTQYGSLSSDFTWMLVIPTLMSAATSQAGLRSRLSGRSYAMSRIMSKSTLSTLVWAWRPLSLSSFSFLR